MNVNGMRVKISTWKDSVNATKAIDYKLTVNHKGLESGNMHTFYLFGEVKEL